MQGDEQSHDRKRRVGVKSCSDNVKQKQHSKETQVESNRSPHAVAFHRPYVKMVRNL